MGQHDEYGKILIKKATNNQYRISGESAKVNYKYGQSARIDGTIGNSIAVEVESRVSKQIRGAVLDLIHHPFPNKLLIILPVYANNPEITADQCRYILSCYIEKYKYRVVVTKGSGDKQRINDDVKIVSRALIELGF